MASITMKELLEAGVHFGHQTKRWNPKMKEYIFGERNGIYIIDLQKTLKMFKDASRFMQEQAALGKTVLFVGTKRQAQDAIAEEATRCQMYYVNSRWLGGLLTNWVTIQKSIKRYKELEEMATDGRYELLPKKETIKLERERKHLHTNLVGIKDMPGLPDVLFVVDSNNEQIAVKEARKLGIPVVGVVDTNCDPTEVDFVIPGNDDALRAIRLFTSRIADACQEGRQLMEAAGQPVTVGEAAPEPDDVGYAEYAAQYAAEQKFAEYDLKQREAEAGLVLEVTEPVAEPDAADAAVPERKGPEPAGEEVASHAEAGKVTKS